MDTKVCFLALRSPQSNWGRQQMINYTKEICTRIKVQHQDSCCGTKCFHDSSLSTSSSPDSLGQCAKTLMTEYPPRLHPGLLQDPSHHKLYNFLQSTMVFEASAMSDQKPACHSCLPNKISHSPFKTVSSSLLQQQNWACLLLGANYFLMLFLLFSGSVVSNPLRPHSLQHARLPCPSEFAQTHVHWVNDVIQPSHPLSPPSSPTS